MIEVFIADCHAAFPRGAELRVFDRKGRRRILRGDEDVTRLGRRIVYFTFEEKHRLPAWHGDRRELIRLIAFGLYGDANALRYKGK